MADFEIIEIGSDGSFDISTTKTVKQQAVEEIDYNSVEFQRQIAKEDNLDLLQGLQPSEFALYELGVGNHWLIFRLPEGEEVKDVLFSENVFTIKSTSDKEFKTPSPFSPSTPSSPSSPPPHPPPSKSLQSPVSPSSSSLPPSPSQFISLKTPPSPTAPIVMKRPTGLSLHRCSPSPSQRSPTSCTKQSSSAVWLRFAPRWNGSACRFLCSCRLPSCRVTLMSIGTTSSEPTFFLH